MSVISVIVPIYNLEDYLPRCLDSIINQTYNNLEIILVDDGSKDNSPAICDEYAQKDSRIKVIHKANGGVSSARNEGLKIAQGEYITFVDGDDIVNDKMLEILLKNAQEHKCDISCCQLQTVYINGKTSNPFSEKSRFFKKEELIEKYFFDEHIKCVMYGPYNKLFKSELIKNIYFKNYKYGEDVLFVFEALAKSNGMYYDEYIGYRYIHREGSAMKSAFSEKRLDYITATKEILFVCKEKYPFAYENCQIWFYRNTIVTLRSIIISNNKKKFASFFKEYKKFLKDNKNNLLPKQSLMRKIDYYLIMYFNFGLHIISKIRR